MQSHEASAIPERFFGVNERTLLWELGLSEGRDDRIISLLANKALAYAGVAIGEVRPGEDYTQIVSRLNPALQNEERACTANRPRYIKNGKETISRNDELLTVQLIRQHLFPSWLSMPYVGGVWLPVPGVAMELAAIDECLDWNIPLVMTFDRPLRLPGSDWLVNQLTDIEARVLWQHQAMPDTRISQAWTTQSIEAPRPIRAPSVYTELDPAWGLYLEGITRALTMTEKRQQGRVMSGRGRYLASRELAQLTPILRHLEQSENFRILGWGNGKVHLAGAGNWQQELNALVEVCERQEAYVYTRREVFAGAGATCKESGFKSAYFRIIQSESSDEIASIIGL
jgi:hypothetical protein